MKIKCAVCVCVRERKNVCYRGAPIQKDIQFKPEGKTNTEIQFKLQILYIFRKHLCFVDHFFTLSSFCQCLFFLRLSTSIMFVQDILS